jgi:dolichol-phosphate mannosyltransferase
MNITLSFVIPAYNEQKTLEQIVDKILQTPFEPHVSNEIIIVNDCSTDSTLTVANSLASLHPNIRVISNPRNLGKSQSVRQGISKTTGDYVIIQDADLEYDPADIPPMLMYLHKYKCNAVYGNRFGVDNGVVYLHNFVGNLGLSLISNLFTMTRLRVYIPDMEVCYKLAEGDLMRQIGQSIKSVSNFGFEPEITAKLAKHKARLVVAPVRYYPRTIQDGKKMKAFRDGLKALWEIIYFNLFDSYKPKI